jgi:hypothetical protein
MAWSYIKSDSQRAWNDPLGRGGLGDPAFIMLAVKNPFTGLSGGTVRTAGASLPTVTAELSLAQRSATAMVKTWDLVPTHGQTMSRREFLRLKESISNIGVQETIKYVEHNGVKYVVDGHHRLQAATELGIREVRAELYSSRTRVIRVWSICLSSKPMAAWQFDLYLVPKQHLATLLGAHPISISRELFEKTIWWDACVPPDLLDADLRCFLRKTNSWHPEVAVWGESDGNRIDVVYESDHIIEVFIRIDLRQSVRVFMMNLIRLARNYDCFFVTTNMRVLEPTLSNLMRAVQESDAFRFVDAPENFLDSLNCE